MVAAVDRVSIPLLVIFDPGGREIAKMDWYTADQVLEAIEEARSAKVALR